MHFRGGFYIEQLQKKGEKEIYFAKSTIKFLILSIKKRERIFRLSENGE